MLIIIFELKKWPFFRLLQMPSLRMCVCVYVLPHCCFAFAICCRINDNGQCVHINICTKYFSFVCRAINIIYVMVWSKDIESLFLPPAPSFFPINCYCCFLTSTHWPYMQYGLSMTTWKRPFFAITPIEIVFKREGSKNIDTHTGTHTLNITCIKYNHKLYYFVTFFSFNVISPYHLFVRI